MRRLLVCLATILSLTSLSLASSVVEVLYLAQPQGNGSLLLTYKVSPKNAVAQQIGSTDLPASSMVPLTVGKTHLLYVWNSTDVWVYTTDANGVPQSKPSQHLTFGFAHPVQAFIADRDGKFAYAAVTWYDNQGNFTAQLMLLTIDPATGLLTNTGRTAASYGPSQYFPLESFFFLGSHTRLYTLQVDDGPHTCIQNYDYFPVDQTTGLLGNMKPLVGWGDCGNMSAGTVSDVAMATSDAPYGQGSGTVVVRRIANGEQITCTTTMLTFCGDESNSLAFDPTSRNLFFSDYDSVQVLLAHIDWASGKLLATGSIPSLPSLFFSPDSKLVYAIDTNEVESYAFDSASGIFTASSLFSRTPGSVSVATATLRD